MTDSEKIQMLSKELNISLAEMAREIGLSRPQLLYDIRNGKCNISKKIANRISDKFDISVLWLSHGIGSMYGFFWGEEKGNWIVSENSYTSNPNGFKRVGLRIDELCTIKNINNEKFAIKIGIDYEKLMRIIMGVDPATDELLDKIIETFSDISPCWLCTGIGTPLKQDNKNLKGKN